MFRNASRTSHLFNRPHHARTCHFNSKYAQMGQLTSHMFKNASPNHARTVPFNSKYAQTRQLNSAPKRQLTLWQAQTRQLTSQHVQKRQSDIATCSKTPVDPNQRSKLTRLRKFQTLNVARRPVIIKVQVRRTLYCVRLIWKTLREH